MLTELRITDLGVIAEAVLGINAERRYGWAVWPDQEEALRQAVRDIAPDATLVEVVGKRDDQGREYWAPVEARVVS